MATSRQRGAALVALVALAALVALVGADAASGAAAAAATPAHSSGKKGKKNCPNAQSCGLATEAELQAVADDVQKLVDAESGTFMGIKASYVTDSTALPPGPPCTVTDFGGGALIDWGGGCSAAPGNYLPQTLELAVTCKPGYFEAAQLICRAYVAGGSGEPIQTLPVAASGTFSRYFTCVGSTEGLPDGVNVVVEASCVCRGYVAPPQQGAKAAAELPPPPHTLAAKIFGSGGR